LAERTDSTSGPRPFSTIPDGSEAYLSMNNIKSVGQTDKSRVNFRGVRDELKSRTPAYPRSRYLLQSEAEVNAAAIVQLYAIDVSVTRR
jgi:hypothetical protein